MNANIENSLLTKRHIDLLKQESIISEDVIKMARLESLGEDYVQDHYGHKSDAILFPYYNLMFEDYKGDRRIRFDIPKLDKNGKGQRYSQKKGSNTCLYFIPPDIKKIKDIKVPLIITEGEKKLLTIRSISELDNFATIAIPGCYGYSKNGKVSDDYDLIPLYEREVYFVGDSDFKKNENVFLGYEKLITYLISKGAIVHLIDLSDDSTNLKIGADDFIKNFGSKEFIKKLNTPLITLYCYEKALQLNLPSGDFFMKTACDTEENRDRFSKKIISTIDGCTAGNIDRKANEGKKRFGLIYDPDDEILFDDTKEPATVFLERLCNKLSNRFELLLMRNTIVVINYNDSTYSLLSNLYELNGFIGSAITVKRLKSNSEIQYIYLKDEYISQILYNPKKYFKQIKEITSISNLPYVLNKDGGFVNGIFDQVCYVGKPLSPLEEPLGLNSPLFKVLYHLPFKTIQDRLDFLGCLIGLFFTPNFLGSHPMIILKGDGPGVSKSTLAELIDVLVNLVLCGSIAFKVNDEELEKQIATKVLRSNVVIIDNVKSSRTISSPLLEKCATDSVLTFRQLGSQKTIERPNDCLFILTLNGGTFSEDILDRSIVIELSHEAKAEKSFDYNGMIYEYVRENRDLIIQELGTMIRNAFHNKEQTYEPQIGLHRFNGWANKVNQVMKFYGYQFLETHNKKKLSNDPFLISLVRLSIEINQMDLFQAMKPFTGKRDFYFFDEPKSSTEIINEIKKRQLDFQLDMSSSLIGKQLQRLSRKKTNIVEYEDEQYNIVVNCLKNSSGGNNTVYEVRADKFLQ